MVDKIIKTEKLPAKKLATKLLCQGIENEFTQYLKTLEFEREKVKYSDGLDYAFRRVLPNRHDLVDVQFDKYHNPSFVINFGSVPSEGIIDGYDRVIPPENVVCSMLVINGRLVRKWFRWFGVSKIKCNIYGVDKVVTDEINLAIRQFQKVENWFNTRKTCFSLKIFKNEHNESGSRKRYMIEQGTWPPEGWEDDEFNN